MDNRQPKGCMSSGLFPRACSLLSFCHQGRGEETPPPRSCIIAVSIRSRASPAMSLSVYLAFVAACLALALLPGPNVTLLIANGLRHGTRAALTNIAGSQPGFGIAIGLVAGRL